MGAILLWTSVSLRGTLTRNAIPGKKEGTLGQPRLRVNTCPRVAPRLGGAQQDALHHSGSPETRT